MIRIRRSAERGYFRNAWLDARLSFSFGTWRNPECDRYSDLIAFNDDRVAPGGGFAEHGHRDVEVMSYPLAGAIAHRDSLGHAAIMRPGDVHLMRAGSGIRHSEMNASMAQPERHLQWWISPWRTGLAPTYERIHVPDTEKSNRWRLIGSPDGAEGSLRIAQDARIYSAIIAGERLAYAPPPGRRTFLHVARGAARCGDQEITDGDCAFIDGEPVVVLSSDEKQPCEVLLFDLRDDRL